MWETLGSWMKLWPERALGGNSPVQESFKHSIMVVLPAPLWPTIRVKGLKKVTTFLFSGSKLRMPLISILSTVLIFARSLARWLVWLVLRKLLIDVISYMEAWKYGSCRREFDAGCGGKKEGLGMRFL